MGFAVRSALGDEGWDIWATWSQQSAKWDEKVARQQWRSFKPWGGITVRTLYHEARERGWRPGGGDEWSDTDWEDYEAKLAACTKLARQAEERRAAKAAERAERIIGLAERAHHPYLIEKGFPDMQWPVWKNRLVIPVRRRGRVLRTVQLIGPDGDKKFLYGGKVGGGSYMLGVRTPGKAPWYGEGFATCLSIQAALRELRIQVPIIVCFSDYGVVNSAQSDGRVIADHDWWTCLCKYRWDGPWPQKACPKCGNPEPVPPAGERAARATGCRWLLPPDPGSDFNDFHLKYGIEAAVQAVRTLLRPPPF